MFEGLFPNGYESLVQDLLFAMAHWHSLAKLRMHTDLSLEVLDSWTSVLGDTARAFVASTSQIETRELKSEYEARKRRELRESATKKKTNRKGKKSEKEQGVDVSSRLGMSSSLTNLPVRCGLLMLRKLAGAGDGGVSLTQNVEGARRTESQGLHRGMLTKFLIRIEWNH